MEKRVSIRDIAEMHLSQQLERKKGIIVKSGTRCLCTSGDSVDTDAGYSFAGRPPQV